jgi:hypothetical protein
MKSFRRNPLIKSENKFKSKSSILGKISVVTLLMLVPLMSPSAAQAASVCSGEIYWGANFLDGPPYTIGRAITSNSAISSVNNSFLTTSVAAVSIVGDENYLYYANNNQELYKVDKTTLVQTKIFSLASFAYSMALRDGKLYVGTTAGTIFKYLIGADGSATLDSTISSLGFNGVIDGVAVDDNYLYYSSTDDSNTPNKFIGRANLDGSGANPDFIAMPTLIENPTDLKVDSNYIYWVDYGIGLKRANLDGTNIVTLITSNRMETFAIDSNYIYLDNWNGSTPFSIARANLDGTNLDLNFIATDPKPIGLYVETNSCSTTSSWVGAQSISCPEPNPWVKEKIGFARQVNPVVNAAENLTGKTIAKGSLETLGKSGVVFDTTSTKVSTATETLPIYGCKDKLLSGKINQPIQFIAGGYTLQSDAHGYINTADQKWHDINAVTLYTNTAAFMHTVKFTKAGKYVVVLTEQPDTSRGLIPTYGVRSIRFVININ